MRCNVSLSSYTWRQVRAECNWGGCEGSWERREKGEIESCALPANSCHSSYFVDFSAFPASCSSGYFCCTAAWIRTGSSLPTLFMEL